MKREDAEILIARYFDGDLSAAEKAQLDAEIAADRELAELFNDNELGHRSMESLRLNWALPADFAARIGANLPTSEVETLIARYFDGELSTAEQEELKKKLANDRELAELFNDNELAHRSMESLKLRWSLPADFSKGVVAGLPEESVAEAPVISMFNWRQLAVAASILVLVSLMLTVAYINRDQRLPEWIAPEKPITEPNKEFTVTTTVLAYSSGNIQVSDSKNSITDKNVQRDVILPADVTAPADTHAVVKVGNGKAVLSPGAKARLNKSGTSVSVQPIEGDVYVESDADGVMDAQVADVAVSVKKAGVTLRRNQGRYNAIPSHGVAHLKRANQYASISASDLQFAVIGEDGFTVEKGDKVELDSWAAAGRADELKRHVAGLLGLKAGDINVEKWNKVIAAMAAQPRDRATNAYFMQFMIKRGLMDDCSPEQREAFAKIAEILAHGTTEQDVDIRAREWIKRLNEALDQDPESVKVARMMVKGWFDSCELRARELLEASKRNKPDNK